MGCISNVYKIRRHTDPLRSLLLPSEDAYIVSGIRPTPAGYAKAVLALSGQKLELTRQFPLGGFAAGASEPRTTFDWDCADQHLPIGSYRAQLRGWSISLADARPFDIVHSSAPSPIRELASSATAMTWWSVESPRGLVIFPAVTALERAVASSSGAAGLLLSPFREVGMRRACLGDSSYLWIGCRSSLRFRSSIEANGLPGICHSDALCLGYWAHRADGFTVLDEVSASIEANRYTHLPQMAEPMSVRIMGIRVRDTLYAQSFQDHTGRSRWPISWESLHLLPGTGRKGLRLERQSNLAATVAGTTNRSRPFTKRVLSRDQVRETAELLGWSSPSAELDRPNRNRNELPDSAE